VLVTVTVTASLSVDVRSVTLLLLVVLVSEATEEAPSTLVVFELDEKALVVVIRLVDSGEDVST
jgi:hypothetical protein